MCGQHQLLAFLTAAVIAGVGDALPPQRIIGGTEAAPGEFPYQVALRIHGRHVCGGAIIGERHIITAAHCVEGSVNRPYKELRVASGTVSSSGGQTHAVKSVVSHAQYDTRFASSPHDIAIIELANAIKFDKNQDKIDLPTGNATSGVDAIATGWGLQRSSQRAPTSKLMKITLKTLTYEQCQKHLRLATLHPQQICTMSGAGLGVCQGDSGGPLVCDGKLLGLVSFGIPCGRGYPDVYTNVYHYLDWIKKTIESF